MIQVKQDEWRWQWEMFKDDELFLFKDWIFPNTMEDFRGKDILECGCGGGQHTFFIAPYARNITAVDLNTVNIARKRNAGLANVKFVEADIMSMDLGRTFDIVFSIGVVHHTDNPDKAFENLKKHLRPGGKLLLWVYSEEGNFLIKYIVEPMRKLLLRRMNRNALFQCAKVLTFLMYLPVYSIYLLPLKFFPYYEYFKNFRKLTFYRNCLNVFDKLNAPQVTFINRKRVEGWFNSRDFKNTQISSYRGVSWRASGIKNG
ncbi:MAG: class I SAM-dependent methyltransferase [Candidatus Omnitrophica bacterium]|nr:class I SAM-dependent methyltransferase [Candidatus Omnitrophota bacterium]